MCWRISGRIFGCLGFFLHSRTFRNEGLFFFVLLYGTRVSIKTSSHCIGTLNIFPYCEILQRLYLLPLHNFYRSQYYWWRQRLQMQKFLIFEFFRQILTLLFRFSVTFFVRISETFNRNLLKIYYYPKNHIFFFIISIVVEEQYSNFRIISTSFFLFFQLNKI